VKISRRFIGNSCSQKLRCMEVSGQLHSPLALPLEDEHRYPLNGRLGGPQSRSGQFWRTEIFLALAGIRTSDRCGFSKEQTSSLIVQS
jgi:hypothetical protein